MRKILLFILGLSVLIACDGDKSQSTNSHEITSSTPETSDATTPFTTIENIGGLLGDDSMFPFVYVEAVNKLRFEAYTMKFKLEHPDVLIPLNNTDTPWINAESYSEVNGQFVTYIRGGRELNLNNPYIMVQYISKSLPYCSTVDSVYMWLDDRFLEKGAKGSVVSELHELDTRYGEKAICKEYRTPKTPEGKAAKRMSYAYFDYNDDYIIGMNMTALSESDFELSRNDFFDLVKSYEVVK